DEHNPGFRHAWAELDSAAEVAFGLVGPLPALAEHLAEPKCIAIVVGIRVDQLQRALYGASGLVVAQSDIDFQALQFLRERRLLFKLTNDFGGLAKTLSLVEQFHHAADDTGAAVAEIDGFAVLVENLLGPPGPLLQLGASQVHCNPTGAACCDGIEMLAGLLQGRRFAATANQAE